MIWKKRFGFARIAQVWLKIQRYAGFGYASSRSFSEVSPGISLDDFSCSAPSCACTWVLRWKALDRRAAHVLDLDCVGRRAGYEGFSRIRSTRQGYAAPGGMV